MLIKKLLMKKSKIFKSRKEKRKSLMIGSIYYYIMERREVMERSNSRNRNRNYMGIHETCFIIEEDISYNYL